MMKMESAGIITAALVSSMLTAAAIQAAPSTPKRFQVGVGAPTSNGRVIRGATAPGGTLTVARASVTLQADGSQVVTLIYTNSANAVVSQRTLLIDSACSRVIDNLGNVVAAAGPATECSAATSFITQLDSTINTAATGGKLNL
jgi:hypothetical protein